MSITNILPNRTPSALQDAQGREIETLPYEVWRVIEACDDTLRAHGMQMTILCEHCAQGGHEHPFVIGDNQRGAQHIEMRCPHKRRLYVP